MEKDNNTISKLEHYRLIGEALIEALEVGRCSPGNTFDNYMKRRIEYYKDKTKKEFEKGLK